MQFTRLRLLGFKSFVDPTDLVIAPGLTGVVGPNGCGKSNLLEALRWVMGESRPTAMRGDGMEDVIFAGTGSRPARNHAEVMLTVDNRDRTAPQGFNDADALDVVRRITRDAGSAYRVNGREARARDVTTLFADAATGAHSHALVRQGQIAELINAKPKARRRILEEAAGISGLYARRHEAELKLRATETNLARVADVIEALDGQLAQLARQARAAARYRAIADDLRRTEALLLWRLWADAEAERVGRAAALSEALRVLAAAETAASRSARELEAAEKAMPAHREEDAVAAAVLQRALIERDGLDRMAEEAAASIEELAAAEAQIAADRARETDLNGDAAAEIARLGEEQAGLEDEARGHPEALSAARAAAEAAQAALDTAEAARSRAAEDAARLSADRASASRDLAEARRRGEDAARARVQADEARSAGEADMTRTGAALDASRLEADAAASTARKAEGDLTAAERAAAEAGQAARNAEARASEASGTARALAAEAESIARLLSEEPAPANAALDAIRVEPGFEAALGAVLAEDLSLPLLEDGDDASGWRRLDLLAGPSLPDGAAPLSAHVEAPPHLARRLTAIGVAPAGLAANLQASLAPGQVLVSPEGDVWRWDGLHRIAGSAPSAAALVLQRKNRLAALRAEHSGAEARASALAAEAAEATTKRDAATSAEAVARARRRDAEQREAETARAAAKAASALEALETRLTGLRETVARHEASAEEAALAIAEAEAAWSDLADPAEAEEALEAARVHADAARIAALTRRAAVEELERTAAVRDRRLAEIARLGDEWRGRQASAAARLEALAAREAETSRALAAARSRPSEIAEKREALEAGLAEAEARRRKAADALAEAETALRAATETARASDRAAGEAREARARAEALAEAATEAASAAAARLHAEQECAPEALLAAHDMEPDAVPEAPALEAEAERLRRARDSMGAVNLRAEEDAREIETERDGLAAERDDLEAAVAKLRQGIGGLNREGRTRLLDAFEEVNRNFAALFRHLFGGGEASLVLVESEDPLEAGLEIMCQPPGKKLSTLSLLSGGEQTLTALSLIFGVFLANPSPICVLDEVDAPLDDANVTRFCDLLDEMTQRGGTRFLIITHHAITMARMDRLFGVTMVERGVSQLVSVDLAAAERIVEPA